MRYILYFWPVVAVLCVVWKEKEGFLQRWVGVIYPGSGDVLSWRRQTPWQTSLTAWRQPTSWLRDYWNFSRPWTIHTNHTKYVRERDTSEYIIMWPCALLSLSAFRKYCRNADPCPSYLTRYFVLCRLRGSCPLLLIFSVVLALSVRYEIESTLVYHLYVVPGRFVEWFDISQGSLRCDFSYWLTSPHRTAS